MYVMLCVQSDVSTLISDYIIFSQFLQPAFPGSLRQVARNTFNLVWLSNIVCVCACADVGHVVWPQVFCFDPNSQEGVELVEYIALFLDNLVPVRSVHFLPSPQRKVDTAQ